jgi:hypothetical protein
VSSYQEIEKILSVLSALVLRDDVESAEKLAAGIALLDRELQAFFETNPQLEKNQMISLLAKIDSLQNVAQRQSGKTKESIVNINQRLKAQRGYGAK